MIARFDDFELDTKNCRISRAGEPVRIEKLPLDLLILLVERQGELLRRDEIAAALWSDAAVDEGAIHTAIRKIRLALGDDSASPRYIETVPRRGYRFKAGLSEAPPIPRRRAFSPLWVRIAAVALTAAVVLIGAIMAGGIRTSRRYSQLKWRPLTKDIHIYTRLASDGKSVFWTDYNESGCKPYQIPIDGGDATPVPIPFPNAFVMDATTDGRLLLIARENCKGIDIQGPLWEMTLASGKTRRTGELVGQDAAYAPDGKRIAFANWDRLFIANRDGSDAKQIAQAPGMIWTMHWSPDGKRLRFSLQLHTEYRFPLWEVSADGSGLHSLLPEWNDATEDLGGVWGPDGDFLFGAKRAGVTDLWRLSGSLWKAHSSRLERITNGPLDFSGPAVLPGHNELAVIGTRRQGELVRFDAGAHEFVPMMNGISVQMMDYSRDGKWVTYVTYPERELWRSRADGSEALQLTHPPLRAGLPRISPDGKQIAFTGDLGGRELRTYLVRFNGGDSKPLTALPASMAEVGPTWSPDGTRLLVRLDRALQQNVLEIVDTATGAAQEIPGSEHKFNQRWSPNGRWIVASPNNESELDLYDVETGQWSVLATLSVDYPNWSADSKWVYFDVHTDKAEEIYRVSVAGRRPELVANLGKVVRAFDDVYSQWVGLTPEGSPMVLRSVDLQQIYLLSFAE